MSKEGTKQPVISLTRDSGRSYSDSSSEEFSVDNPSLRFPFQVVEMKAQPIPYIEESSTNVKFVRYLKPSETQAFSPHLCGQPNTYVPAQQNLQHEEPSACSDFISVVGCVCVCFLAVFTCDSL